MEGETECQLCPDSRGSRDTKVTKISLDVIGQLREIASSAWFSAKKKVTIGKKTETETVQVRGTPLFLSVRLRSGLGSSVSFVPTNQSAKILARHMNLNYDNLYSGNGMVRFVIRTTKGKRA